MKKQNYLTPETSAVPIQPERPLCLSGLSAITATPGLLDYDLLDASDITWDD